MTDAFPPDLGLADLAKRLYEDAWGKVWPYKSSGKISIADISPDKDVLKCADGGDSVAPLADGNVNAAASGEWAYTCLHNIKSVAIACGGPNMNVTVEDVLIIRDEYVYLRDAMESGCFAKTNAMVVTGHPGVGKTVFLLYLLLYRLEHRRPTAIQLSPSFAVIFNDKGAFICPATAFQLLVGYWALVGLNEIPCDAFLESPRVRIIQSTGMPPNPGGWKNWLKQKYGKVIVSDLPRPLEIGAILKELRLRDYAQAYHYISKWGPCTRTIIEILREDPVFRARIEQTLSREATAAAVTLCEDPTEVSCMHRLQHAHSISSTLLFTRPYRSLPSAVLASSIPVSYIPTPYLADIFNTHRHQLPKALAAAFVDLLTPRTVTKSFGGRSLEQDVHVSLCFRSAPLTIFRGQDSRTIKPARRLLAGTVDALADVKAYPSFYWLPPTSEFTGIDAVLADSENAYAIQATTADDHDSPVDGLQKVWMSFDRDVRTERAWHVVVISEREELARRYADVFADEVETITLGQEEIPVEVWGCVLPSLYGVWTD
ncbi:hypothetical protein LXA43DRAFT_716584 [Ganoderma leucocontextum]|nr:hypothetical protein LXA43DRAFT_716584 [Ganoderma leucocontextum]